MILWNFHMGRRLKEALFKAGWKQPGIAGPPQTRPGTRFRSEFANAPPLPGRCARNAPKDLGEVALIREAGQDRYVGERCPSLEQKFLGAFDAGRTEPAIPWGASGCFEFPGELRLAAPNQFAT